MAECNPEADDLKMSEELRSITDDYEEILCDPCQDDGDSEAAEGFCVDCNEHLCTACYKTHLKPRPFKNHVLKDKENMPQIKSNNQQGAARQKCQHHQNEDIVYYCQSHDQVGCTTCKKMFHRQCDVSTIADICKDLLGSDEYQQVNEKLTSLKQDIDRSKDIVKRETERVNAYHTAALNDFAKVITRIKDKDTAMMRDLSDTCETLKSELTSLTSDFGTLNENNVHTFITLKKAKNKCKSFEDSLVSVKTDINITGYIFVPATSSTSQQILGKLVVVPSHLEDINIKSTTDGSNCSIAGMEILADGKLFVADFSNTNVKLLDLTTKAVISELKLETSEYMDVALVNDGTVAVTITSKKKILILSISDTVRLDKTIATDSGCQGIVHSNGTLIVTFDPCKVQILDMTGTLKHTFDKDGSGNGLFGDSVSITTSSCCKPVLYLSDSPNHRVISLTMTGDVISSFQHENMKKPRGIAVGSDGDVFVCCYESHNIFQLTSDLSKGKVIFHQQDGLLNPRSILYNDNKLYVGSSGKNVIQGFLL